MSREPLVVYGCLFVIPRKARPWASVFSVRPSVTSVPPFVNSVPSAPSVLGLAPNV